MKKVVASPDFVDVKDVLPTGYYGFTFPYEGKTEVGFITRQEYNRGKYIATVARHCCNGNSLYGAEENSLEATLRYLVSCGEVFEFHSAKALFEWLARNTKF